MTNHLCAPPSQNDCFNQVVIIELPNGSTAKILVGNTDCATVRDLKLGCELQFGIPANLQRVSALENPEIELSDWILLKDTVQTIDDVIVVQVPVWWNKFICVSLNNEIENVCRRAKLPMQQISKEERLFVGFFIACCCGHENLLERLRTLDIHFDQQAATESGRNLFHASAASGNVSCVEFVAKHLVKPSKEILSKLDTNRETPIDIARRFNNQDAERLLYKLLFYEKGEREQRNSDESGIDVCDSVDSDDSLEGTKPRHDNTDQEETQKNCENNHPGMPKNGFEDGELVITECDEGDSFAVDVKQEPKKNSPKSKDGVFQQDGLSNSGARGDQMRATSPFSSDSSDDCLKLSPRLNRPQTLDLSPKKHLLRRRFVNEDPSGRPKSARTVQYPQINVYQEEDEEVGPNENHLPPLDNQTLVSHNAGNAFSKRMKQTVVRTISNSHSAALKERLIPSPDEEPLTSKSAPGSPQTLRRMVFKPSSKPPSSPGSIRVCPLSPNMSRVLDQRRGSEPVACLNRTNGIRLGRARRDAVISTDLTHGGDGHVSAMPSSPRMYKRGKSRSICEVSLTDSLRCRTDMEDEERLDRPWNAWIAVRKESLQLVNKDSASQSPTNPRRMSYQQWLSEKELTHLRKIFANAQEEAKTNEKQAKLLKGKTFDEWLEDKRREMEREKEKEKGTEENQKQEEDKKQQRRRMSQVKYEKWLMQKERNALQQAEKMVQLAKEKHELMKKKWEEEDEQKKNCKLSLGRTHSLPVEGNPRTGGINKNRFTSLK